MGGGPKERVLSAFDEFKGSTSDRSDQLEKLHSKLTEAEVEYIAFGLMPSSFQLRDMYNEVNQDVLEGLQETTEFMSDLGDTIKHVRDQYEESEQVSAEGLQNFMQALEG